MSHKSRRGPPIECPLASLGHNSPSLDSHQPYHPHPLSSSPLNPEAYQMPGTSPILNTVSPEEHLFSARNRNVNEPPISGSGYLDQSYNDVPTATVNYRQMPCNYTQDSDSAYQQHASHELQHRRMADVGHNEQYFLEEKMRRFYIQDVAPYRNPERYERYYLEPSLSRSRLDTSSPMSIRHRPSSPSESSETDRYMAKRSARPSPVPLSGITRYLMNQHAGPSAAILKDARGHVGRFSPSLDQGYDTLASPSGSRQHTQQFRNRNRNDSPFHRLSDQLVVKIFAWMDSCELCNISKVCKRFNALVLQPILWKTITLKGEYINGDRALKSILRRLSYRTRNVIPEVERVFLSDDCHITDKGLELLSRRCPELTHLQIQMCASVTNNQLFNLVTKCTNLQHLDVTGCTQLTSIDFNHRIDPPRRLLLKFLDLTDCTGIDDAGLKIVVQNCPQLIYLYLRRCLQISDVGLKFVPSFCTGLRELSVSDCVNITDFALYELAKLGATLRYLSVAKCDQVSDAGLKVIARRCYKLRYLNARGCEAVSDDSITVLAHSCPRLRALDIGKCDVSDAGLHALAESCPNLKKLSLKNCDMITDRGVQCIAYYCRGLQNLNIQDCQVTLEGYRAVKKYCKRCVIEHTNPGFC